MYEAVKLQTKGEPERWLALQRDITSVANGLAGNQVSGFRGIARGLREGLEGDRQVYWDEGLSLMVAQILELAAGAGRGYQRSRTVAAALNLCEAVAALAERPGMDFLDDGETSLGRYEEDEEEVE